MVILPEHLCQWHGPISTKVFPLLELHAEETQRRPLFAAGTSG